MDATPLVDSDDGRWNASVFGPASISVSVGYGAAGPSYHSFFRFPSIPIPQGSVIVSATVTFTASRTDTISPVNTNLYFNASDDAVAPTNYTQAEALALGTAVPWDGIPAWTEGNTYTTPDLASILQEIVSRPGWSAGNSVMLVWKDDGSYNNAVRGAKDIYNGGGGTALLTVEYVIGAQVDETLTFSCLTMSNAFDSIDDDLKFAEILSEKYPIDVEDAIEMASRSRFGFIYAVVTESFLDLYEYSPAAAFHKIIDESLNFEGVPDGGMFELLEEILTLTDSINAPAFILMQDSIFFYDNEKVGWHKLVPDTFNISVETGSGLLGLMISEWLTIKDSQVNNWTGQEIMAETIAINSLPVLIQSSKQTIADTLAIADSPSWRLTLAILDVLGFTELQKAARYSQHQVSESLVLTDEARRGFENLVESVLSAIDASSVIGAFAKSLAESLDLADATSFITRVAGLVNESLVFSETASSAGKLYNIIRESLALNVLMELDGEIWECFVLNTPHFHPSIYSGYDFNSFCVFEGRAFGANEKGIYELTGSTDAGNTIHTGIIMKGTDFGTPNQKRFRRGYFGISGSSPVLILETESGQRQVYNIDTKGKAVASHELKSKSWTLSIADFQTLESAILIPVVLSR